MSGETFSLVGGLDSVFTTSNSLAFIALVVMAILLAVYVVYKFVELKMKSKSCNGNSPSKYLP